MLAKIIRPILILLAVLIVVIVVFTSFFLSPIAVRVANKQLPEILGTEASVESISVSLLRGRAALGGLQIAQPEGFEGEPVIELKNASAEVSLISLVFRPIRVTAITVDSPRVRLIRSREGLLNAEALIPPADPDAEEKEGGPPPAIILEKLVVRDILFSLKDLANPGRETVTSIENLDFELEHLRIYPPLPTQDFPLGIDLQRIGIANALIAHRVMEAEMWEKVAPVAVDVEEVLVTDEPAEEETTAPLPPLRIGSIAVQNINVVYEDAFKGTEEGPYTFHIDNITVTGTDLRTEAARDADHVSGNMDISMAFRQAEGVPPAQLAIENRILALEAGVPAASGFVRLTGFDLNTVQPFLVPGVRTTLGGDAFDLNTDFRTDPENLDVRVRLTTDQGNVIRLSVGGSPSKPSLGGSDLLLTLVGRPGQLITGLTGGLAEGGAELAKGLADSAGGVAAGAGRTVGRVGSGLGGLVRGVASGDMAKATEGLTEATVGAAQTATETVAKAADDLTETTARTREATTTAGQGQANFLPNSPERHAERLAAAREWLASLPFPPEFQ